MPALTPQDAADALYCRGERPIDRIRVEKFLRHIDTREDFEAAVACLPEEVRETVNELAADGLRKKGL